MGRGSTRKAGDIINRTYTLVRPLGAGYSGEVWEARHAHLPASFAVKMMHAEDRNNPHKVSRFRAEAAALYGLDHENVVRIAEANEMEDGLFFLVMELLVGETLTEHLTRGRLHPLRALKYAYDVACGLDAAHEIGVVHRDVKPENLFVTHKGVVKILDFTAAKFFLAGLRTTEPGAKVGTVAFMSPEHIEGEDSDARLDQYSLGLCLYCMLCGHHPFERHFGSQFALMTAQSKEVPEPLVEVAGLPAWLDDLLAPALAKDIAKRYPTMAHFAQAIHEAMCRVAREEQEGTLAFDVPLGEPPIDVEAREVGRASRSVYLAARPPVRQTTAPVAPAERVSIAPGALLDAPATTEATVAPRAAVERTPAPPASTARVATASRAGVPPEGTVTIPLPPAGKRGIKPEPSHRTTTAPVLPMTTTRPVRRKGSPSRWIAGLALALTVLGAGGLARRVRGWMGAPSAAARVLPIETAASVPAPLPAVAVPPPDALVPVASAAPSTPPSPEAPATVAPTLPPAATGAEIPFKAPRAVAAPAHVPPPSPRRDAKATPAPEAAHTATAPLATATAALPIAPPPAPTAAHRVFGTEN